MDGPVHARPAISLIAEGLGPHHAALYIGGSDGASDPGLLRQHGIATIINCAVNLDINLVRTAAEEGDRLAVGHGDIRYYKLGLIDGEGKVVWAAQSENYQRRSGPEIVLAALERHLP